MTTISSASVAVRPLGLMSVFGTAASSIALGALLILLVVREPSRQKRQDMSL